MTTHAAMTQKLTPADRYLLQQAQLPPSSDQAINLLRQRGAKSLARLGFPPAAKGNEEWKYTNLRPLAGVDFSPADDAGHVDAETLLARAPHSPDWLELVFVNGRFVPSASSDAQPSVGVAANLNGGNGHGALARMGAVANVETDAFAALNTAFLADAAIIMAPKGRRLPPVHVINVAGASPRPAVSHPRALIVASEGAECTVIETYIGAGEATYFTNSVVEVVVGPGARVDHYRLMMDAPQSFHVGGVTARLDEDSTFRSLQFSAGARIARNGLRVLLAERGSSCIIGGLYYTRGTEHVDNHIVIDHLAPHTTSDLYFKGIVDGRSRAVFSGGVTVHPNAQKSEAYQKDQNLLLSRGARINTKPMLEIYADDIKAMHGATAGAIADEAIFYMRSRGIDESTARELLVHGFAREVVDRVPLPPLRDFLHAMYAGGQPRQRLPNASAGGANHA